MDFVRLIDPDGAFNIAPDGSVNVGNIINDPSSIYINVIDQLSFQLRPGEGCIGRQSRLEKGIVSIPNCIDSIATEIIESSGQEGLLTLPEELIFWLLYGTERLFAIRMRSDLLRRSSIASTRPRLSSSLDLLAHEDPVRGIIERLDHFVSGWIVAVDDSQLEMNLWIDSIHITSFYPGFVRPDLSEIIPASKPQGFSLSLPELVLGLQKPQLERVLSISRALPGWTPSIVVTVGLDGPTLPFWHKASMSICYGDFAKWSVAGESLGVAAALLAPSVERSFRPVGLFEMASPDNHPDIDKPILIVYFPDYTSTNPYQECLYSTLDGYFDTEPGPIEQAIEKARCGENVIFHLHWPEPIFSQSKTQDEFVVSGFDFLRKIKLFQHLNGHFLITTHNVSPHEKEFKKRYEWFIGELLKLADAIHVHNYSAIPVLKAVYDFSEEKCLVVPHGSYNGLYPQRRSKEEARAELGISNDAVLFAFVGQLRPYKGLEQLYSAFRALAARQSGVELLIAGKPVHPTPPGRWAGMARSTDRLHVFEGFIRDEDLQTFFAASDCVVLPYSDILTSGSALLAATFGKPTILPDLPTMRDFERAGFALTYNSSDPTVMSLLQSLETFLALDQTEISRMRTNAFSFSKENEWPRLSAMFSKLARRMKSTHLNERVIAGHSCLVEIRSDTNHLVGSVGVAIVNYHSSSEVESLLDTLPRASCGRNVAVFVIDNSCSNSEIAAFRRMRTDVIVDATKNLGYAAGNNILIELIKEMECEFIFIINPDIKLQTHCIDELIDCLSDRAMTVASPLVLKSDGRVSFAGGFIKSAGDFAVSHYLDGAPASQVPKEIYSVDILNGCSVFMSVMTLRSVPAIPERYFLYYEETDWFSQLRSSGISLVIQPKSRVEHSKKSHGKVVPTLYYVYYLCRNAFLLNSAMGGNSSGVRRRLRNTFYKGWKKKLTKDSPSFLPIFERTVAAGFEDGERGVEGPIDVGLRLDAVQEAGQMLTKGYVDSWETGSIKGWLCHRSENAEPGEWMGGGSAWLIIDDAPYAEVGASTGREDVLAAGYAFDTGFTFPIPSILKAGANHKIEIRSGITGRRIPFKGGKLSTVLCTSPGDRPAATVEAQVIGRIEGIKDGVLRGWACDRHETDRPTIVDIQAGASLIRDVEASSYREDLERAGLGNGCHAFRVALPSNVLNLQVINCSVKINGKDTEITSRRVAYDVEQREYKRSFDLPAFLRWSFLNFEVPPGAYPMSPLLRAQLDASRRTWSAPAPQAAQPLISIIMPVFNRKSVVARAIESIISQTYNTWELIIVDDGSTDGSVEEVVRLVRALQDTRIKHIRLSSNVGVSAARNVGLSKASGEIVAYLDSDNEWYPEALALLSSPLVSSPEFMMSYAGQEIWEHLQDGEVAELRSVRLCPFSRSKLEERNFIDLNIFCHRLVLFKSLGGFREDMTRLVDWELILRYTRSYSPAFVPAIANRYFVNAVVNQLTKTEPYGENYAKIMEVCQ